MRWVILGSLGICVCLRAMGLLPMAQTVAPSPDRHAIVALISETPESAKRFGFDPDAENLLGAGADGAPGILGVDDNANGTVDDIGELGAVGSDDQCVAPSDPSYSIVANQASSIVISNGAFVAEFNGSPEDRYQIDTVGWFVAE